MLKVAIVAFIGLAPCLAFSIEIVPPKDWVASQTLSPGVVQQYFDSKKSGDFVSNLVVIKRKISGSASSFDSPEKLIEMIVGEQARSFPQYKVLEKKKKTVNGINGALVSVSYAYGNLNLSAFQFAWYAEGIFQTVVFTTRSEDFDGARSIFQKSLLTIR